MVHERIEHMSSHQIYTNVGHPIQTMMQAKDLKQGQWPNPRVSDRRICLCKWCLCMMFECHVHQTEEAINKNKRELVKYLTEVSLLDAPCKSSRISSWLSSVKDA